MKPDTKQILKGSAIAGAMQVGGALLGAGTNTACTGASGQPADAGEFFCGPRAGALIGSVGAGGLSMTIGAALAVFSPKRRLVGIGMFATPMILDLASSLIARATAPSIPKTSLTANVPTPTPALSVPANGTPGTTTSPATQNVNVSPNGAT